MNHVMKVKTAVMGILAVLAVAIATPALGDTPPVNLNTATVAELTMINGIGPAKAKAIVEYRDAHGTFASVDDLQSVGGIGPKLLDRVRPQVTVGEAEQKADKPE